MEVVYQKTLPLYTDADIVVAGGGPSGVAAAVCAARMGKRVVLIEQSGSLGGASVLAMVAELMNFDDGKNFISGGIGKEIFDRLAYECRYERQWYNVHYEQLKRIYDDLVLNAGVDVLFYTKLTDVISENGLIRYAVVSMPDGMYTVSGKMFLDCTGNGSLSCFSGADYEYGDAHGNTMSATICSLWGGVDFSRKKLDSEHYEQAYKDGIFSSYDKVLPGIKANFPQVGVGGGNVGHCFGVDDRDVRSLTQAMFRGRKVLTEYERYYRDYVDGCDNAVLIKSADFIGIRESRRICCETMLTVDSFYEQAAFPDEIGRYSYPIDIHPMTADKKGMDGFLKSVSMRHGDGETYSIPYRCLVPKKVRNLLVAGRCLGADRQMQASARVIPCCYITGQAIGVAASVCIDNRTAAADADVSQIRAALKQMGAYMK